MLHIPVLGVPYAFLRRRASFAPGAVEALATDAGLTKDLRSSRTNEACHVSNSRVSSKTEGMNHIRFGWDITGLCSTRVIHVRFLAVWGFLEADTITRQLVAGLLPLAAMSYHSGLAVGISQHYIHALRIKYNQIEYSKAH